NALQFPFGGLFKGFLDFLIGSFLFQTDGQIHNGYIRSGNPKGHPCEFSLQGGNYLGDRLGGPGGGRDDVQQGAPAPPEILSGRTVNGQLGGRGGVYRGHQGLFNAKGIVEYLGQGGQTVGGT